MFSIAKRQFSTTPIAKAAKFSVIGRLGGDAVKGVYGENVVYKYNIASAVPSNKMDTDWFTITKFGDSEGFEKIAKKGNLVVVEGDVLPNVYVKEDVTNYSYNFIQKRFQVISYAKKASVAEELGEEVELDHPTESEEIVKNL